MIAESLAVFLLAAAYDILLGEPPAKVHPVVWIGRLITFLRTKAKPSKAGGIALAIIVIAATVLSGHLMVRAAGYVPLLPLLVSAYLLKSTFAIKCLLEVSGLHPLAHILLSTLCAPGLWPGSRSGLQGHQHHGLHDRLQDQRSQGAGLCRSEAR
ncbi:MAG: cobalamin biosynthesis protein [Methanothrix sp.]|nr:cobalamin biosynthesis protein [Methanothrix sp.]